MEQNTTVAKSQADESVAVPGFSERFSHLLDLAQVTKQNRYTWGHRRYNVAVNTFKNWCVNDMPPRRYRDLLEVVTDLLSEIPGRYSANAVVAWLYAGEDVANPFSDEQIDYVLLGEAYIYVQSVSQEIGIDFDKLDRKARQAVMNRLMGFLTTAADPRSQLRHLDTRRLIESALQLAELGSL